MHFFQLSPDERTAFRRVLGCTADRENAQRMKGFVQHGRTSTFRHCMRVAKCSFLLSRRLHLAVDTHSLVRGAFLHDFYLYDWHDKGHGRLHGLYHPGRALKNARREYGLNETECNIISSHMWPLTPTALPKSREAMLVCVADKLCSLQETVIDRIS